MFIYINQAMSASNRKETHLNTESKETYIWTLKESVAQKCTADNQLYGIRVYRQIQLCIRWYAIYYM